ncbi:MAG: zf-HC2 domain-containing protein [Pseudomonadota bacterium]|nr:zf-HC2 domain-containing protein [Pseudomonadota bacterium]
MNPASPRSSEHQDVWDLLPWLVNGRLREADRRRVEAHLHSCSACRLECAAQRQIYQIIATEAPVEHMPMAGLNKLRQRIESHERAGPAGAQSNEALPVRRRSGGAPVWRMPRSAIAASVMATATLVGVVAGQVWNRARHHGEPSNYQTVTTPSSQGSETVIRAVFAPSVTLSELQSLLDDAHLRIVSGPTEAGVYSLAETGSLPMDWSLHRLRGHETVRFAEAIGGPSAAAAPPR